MLASLHYITDAVGREKVYTTGGIHYYTDGYRDTPDVMLGYFDYPDRNNAGAFTVQLGANYVDGVSRKWGSLNFRIVGSDGVLDVEWEKVTFTSLKEIDLGELEKLDAVGQGLDIPEKIQPKQAVFKAAGGYKGGHYDHFLNFFTGIRNKTALTADVLFGVRSAIPALLCYDSYLSGKAIRWDPENLRKKK